MMDPWVLGVIGGAILAGGWLVACVARWIGNP